MTKYIKALEQLGLYLTPRHGFKTLKDLEAIPDFTSYAVVTDGVRITKMNYNGRWATVVERIAEV